MSLDKFTLEKIIKNDVINKHVVLLGYYTDPDKKAVVILKRRSFENNVHLNQFKELSHSINDIYTKYELTSIQGDVIDCEIIYPATKKHINRHRDGYYKLVHESAHNYFKNKESWIKEMSHTRNDWINNIINGKSERDKIIHQTSEYIMLPDIKWNEQTLDELHIMNIVTRFDLKSIRDLTLKHLSWLKNLEKDIIETVSEKYNLKQNELCLYLHYPPSYYHLHIHCTHVKRYDNHVGSHLLRTVINNIELVSNYYQVVELSSVQGYR